MHTKLCQYKDRDENEQNEIMNVKTRRYKTKNVSQDHWVSVLCAS
jgi:hypothetical protein